VKRPPRELLIKAFEAEYPGYGEMIKQAMEMRALVIIGRVNEQADVNSMVNRSWEPMLEELFGSRLVLTCAATSSDGGPNLARALVERCLCVQLASLSLVLNHVAMADKECKTLLKRLRLKGEGYWHLIRGVHLASCELGREGLAELIELLMARECALASLDVSYTSVDVARLVQVLSANASLTYLDARKVPRFSELYTALAELLLQPGGTCRLGFLRCDAFDVLENESVLSLRETALSETAQPGGMRLLAGLLAHNATVRELDLTAADIDKSGAQALAAALAVNTSLRTLRLQYNPALDDEAKAALRAAAGARATPLTLEL